MLDNRETTSVGAIRVTRGKRDHSNLDYSILLDVVPRRERPEIAASVRDIIAEAGLKVTRKGREALGVIVANLYAAWITKGNPFLVVPMRSSDYAPGTRLNALWLTCRPTTKAVHALHEAGFVEYHRGIYFEAKKRVTRIRANGRLSDLFIKHRFRLRSIETIPREPVQLRKQKMKGGRGESINISRGAYAAAARPHKLGVESINAALKITRIELHIDEQTFIDNYVRPHAKHGLNPPNPLRNQLYRVFNVDFAHGGRFYGHWVQGLPRDLRRHVRINREPIVELDFKAIHPNLLYAEQGQTFEGEVYLPPSYPKEFRPVFKVLMLAAINAKGPNGAIRGARHCIRQHEDLRRAFPECLKDCWLYPAFDALRDMHKPIEHHFFTGAGLRLQRLDSEIAERIMLTLLASGVVAIPIHDSFQVAEQHEDALREAMLTASHEVCGSAILVDKKPGIHNAEHADFNLEIWKMTPVMDGVSFSSSHLLPTAFAAFSNMDAPDASPAPPRRRRAIAA